MTHVHKVDNEIHQSSSAAVVLVWAETRGEVGDVFAEIIVCNSENTPVNLGSHAARCSCATAVVLRTAT